MDLQNFPGSGTPMTALIELFSGHGSQQILLRPRAVDSGFQPQSSLSRSRLTEKREEFQKLWSFARFSFKPGDEVLDGSEVWRLEDGNRSGVPPNAAIIRNCRLYQ